jgi:hypothetical protein
MLEFISEHPHAPMDATVRSEKWLSSEFRLIRTGDPTFRDVCDVFNSIVTKYTAGQLFHF